MSYFAWKTIGADRAIRAVEAGAEVWALPAGGFFSGGHTYTHGLMTKRGKCYVVSKMVMRAVESAQALKSHKENASDQERWPRANPKLLESFDPATKVCTMNCGPHVDDPRSCAERKLLCTDCEPWSIQE